MEKDQSQDLIDHRPESEILRDLEALCSSPGYLHALAFLCWSENFIGYDPEGLVPDDLNEMKSQDRLIRNEISLLIGLMVKSRIDVSQPEPGTIQQYIDSTKKLLGELHHSIASAMWLSVKNGELDFKKENPLSKGASLREPFFYSGEAAYMFQYRDFSVLKYKNDNEWLKEKKGFLIEDVKKVIDAISEMQLQKIQLLRSKYKRENISDLTLLPAFTFTKGEIIEGSKCSETIVSNILKEFSIQSFPANHLFNEIGAYNEANSYPVLPMENGEYMLLQGYSFAESAYETPFFWMLQDKDYAEKAKENRGLFTERFSEDRLKHVFGPKRVYRNVEIRKGKDQVGEIDILCIYADRAILLEAKSKKLTVLARTGNDEQIKKDFEGAVQKAYDQNFRNGKFLLSPEYTLFDEGGNKINARHDFAEIFIFCVVSEYYPALAHQADQFLVKEEHNIIRSPYVMDVFFIDVLCEMLDSPLHFFNFLHKRSGYSEKVKSENELAVLSYHLAHNLWFDDKDGFVHLGEDFSVYVDAAMLTRREGLPGKRTPEGILTRLNGTFYESLIKAIGNLEEDNVLELGYFLLGMSQKSGEGFSKACETVLKQTRRDNGIHDFSMVFGESGITVHCSCLDNNEAYERLYAHCEIKKYDQKARNWFGVGLNPRCNGYIQIILGLKAPWKKSEEMDEIIKTFPSKPYSTMTEAIESQKHHNKRKIGRNEPCPCGSGKKYKKCHLSSNQSK